MNAETRKAIKEAIAEVFGYPFDEGEFKMHQEALDRIGELVDADRPRLTVEDMESAVRSNKIGMTVGEAMVNLTKALNAILDGKGVK